MTIIKNLQISDIKLEFIFISNNKKNSVQNIVTKIILIVTH